MSYFWFFQENKYYEVEMVMTTRKLGTCISTQICFTCTMSPSQCKSADLFGPRLFACCLVVMNTKMKLTGGKESANPTCHVTFLFIFHFHSPEPTFSLIFQASAILCCQTTWLKPEAGKPLCRQMSSFVKTPGNTESSGETHVFLCGHQAGDQFLHCK